MIIALYTTDDPVVPSSRRYLAQFEKTKPRLIFSFYGATAAEAMKKAQEFWDKEVVPVAGIKKASPPVEVDEDLLGDLM